MTFSWYYSLSHVESSPRQSYIDTTTSFVNRNIFLFNANKCEDSCTNIYSFPGCSYPYAYTFSCYPYPYVFSYRYLASYSGYDVWL